MTGTHLMGTLGSLNAEGCISDRTRDYWERLSGAGAYEVVEHGLDRLVEAYDCWDEEDILRFDGLRRILARKIAQRDEIAG